MPTLDGKKLRAARQRAGLSRDELAQAIGRGYLSVRAYEQGWREPPGSILAAICGAVGSRAEDLLADDEAVPS